MEEIYDEIRDDPLYQRLFELANVHTAERFNLDVPEGIYEEMADAIEDEGNWDEVREHDWFQSAQAMADGEAFFHWELEFPEVFFDDDGDKRGDAGFDAVVGNPPWGADLGQQTERYMTTQYGLSKSANDTFAVFTKLSATLLQPNAELGYILPSGWQTSDKYAGFREWLLETIELQRLVNLPYDVFSDAYVDSSIFVMNKVQGGIDDLSEADTNVDVINYDRKAKLDQIDSKTASCVDYSRWFLDHFDPNDNYKFISYLDKDDLDLEEKTAKNGTEVAEIADIQRGITPFNLVDEDGEEYSPALDGDLRRYTYAFSGQKSVEYHEGIAEYKPERYFTGERLILRELISRQFRLQLVLTDEDFVTNKSYQSILVEDERYDAGYLLAILNSKLLSYYHVRRSAVALRDDFPKIQYLTNCSRVTASDERFQQRNSCPAGV